MTPAIDPHGEDVAATVAAAMRAAAVYSAFWYGLTRARHDERTATALTIAYIQANGFAPSDEPTDVW
jgi:tRNA U34 5-methylaminomethyl-2-thiouridine-forming methyltransferase MnmC